MCRAKIAFPEILPAVQASAGSRRRPRALPLWAAGFLAAVVLCGSEAMLGGWKNALVPDQYNNLALTVSFREALLEPQFPPRVSPVFSDGRGNPYRQFYSPFAHLIPAALSLACGGDAMAGYSAAAALLSALSFVYAWRLSRLLTLSDAASAAGATLFVTAPYLLCDRVLRGAWPEYAAFSMLPMALYFLLRWGGGAPRFLYCAGALGKFARRAARAASAAAFALAMGMFYLAPMALYGDLAIKADTLAGSSLADSSRLVSPLLVLSAADTPAPALSQYRAPRFQLGAALVLSALAYFRLWLRQRGESLQPPPAYALPLLATAALAAGVALLPELAARVFPPADIAQFSYRFIMFVLAAVPMAALAFKGLFPAKPGAGSDGARRGAALALAFFAAAGAAPYLYPPAFIKDWSKTVYEELMAAEGILLPYGNDAYLRCPPPQGSPDWAPPGTRPLPPLPRAGSSARRVFAADLSAAPRLPDGAVPLDVLYYPGIQKFSFRVDGRESQVEIRTYWLPRERLGDARDAAFHGPAALGLPGMGLLEAEARFTGMGWSNAVSAAALSAYVLSWIAVLRRGGTAPALARRAGRRENPGGALLTLPAPRLSIRLRKAIIGPRISGGDRPRTADRLRAD